MNMTSSPFNGKTDRQDLLERALESLLKAPVRLTVTDNRRVMVSGIRKNKAYHLRLHRMFLDADDEVTASLAGYLSGNGRSFCERLRIFFKENREKIRNGSARSKRAGAKKEPSQYLEEMYRKINETYFGGRMDCLVCWSRRRTRRKQKSVRLGSYSPGTGVIRIHSILNDPMVPSYVVENVMYHEMLHHHLGIRPAKGKRFYHHAAFRDMERRFPESEKARLWIGKNLPRLLKRKKESALTS